jgi:hypothetical protein
MARVLLTWQRKAPEEAEVIMEIETPTDTVVYEV